MFSKSLVAAMALTCSALATATNEFQLDINAKYDNWMQPLRIFMPAGTYKARVITKAEGGKYDARNAWNGKALWCDETGANCKYGWQSGGGIWLEQNPSVTAEEQYIGYTQGGRRSWVNFGKPGVSGKIMATPELVANNIRGQVEVEFTVEYDSYVGFADGDSNPWDNKGGLSLMIEMVNPVVPVEIDLKPGSDRNPLKPKGVGKIPVAVFGSEEVDVTWIDNNSVMLNGLAHALNGNEQPNCNYEYVNEDEYLDMVCHFEDDSSDWEPGVGEAMFTANLVDGRMIEGYDMFEVLSVGKGK